jgi:hypothetical protein
VPLNHDTLIAFAEEWSMSSILYIFTRATPQDRRSPFVVILGPQKPTPTTHAFAAKTSASERAAATARVESCRGALALRSPTQRKTFRDCTKRPKKRQKN